jgi:hypothetical protein
MSHESSDCYITFIIQFTVVLKDILESSFEELTKEEKCYVYFWQDNTEGHTAKNAMWVLWTDLYE